MFKSKTTGSGAAPKLTDRLKSIAAKPAPESYVDAPRNVRVPRSRVFRQAVATLEGGEKLPIAIKDLSSSGCRIEFYRQTHLSPRITIDEHSLSLHYEAHVVWQLGGAAGLKFIRKA